MQGKVLIKRKFIFSFTVTRFFEYIFSMHHLDDLFLDFLPIELKEELLERRAHKRVEESDFLLRLAPFMDLFFNHQVTTPDHLEELLSFKKNYLQRHILHHTSAKDLEGVNSEEFLKIKDILNHPLLEKYCIWAIHTKEGREINAKNPLFSLPQKIDPEHPLQTPETLAPFKGFELRDHGMTPLQAHLEAHYCLICHKREKDTCRKGCPLDQKISQMILAYREGHVLGALAIAMVDNPMILATGHRICYDCSMGCIFKTQTPVDIPGIESQILKSVSPESVQALFSWNPLKNSPLPAPQNGYRVLVVGAGPSGFTLSLLLLQRGYEVVMIDALKDFGGVMKYGITPRWDKKLLNQIQSVLESFPHFSFYPGVRFGEMLSLEDSLDKGFDHIAMCIGAAKPKLIGIETLEMKGVHMSNDFLMGLQYGFPLEFPVVVIGAGLSGVDTAVEAVMYGKNRNVSLLYRGKIKDSPAVRQNVKEIQEAVDVGIKILEKREILRIEGGERVEKIIVRHNGNIEEIEAKTVLIAAGTQSSPQVIHERMSYFGDANPKFRGSVVKAMASAKEGIDELDHLIQSRERLHKKPVDSLFVSKIESIQMINRVLELKIKSPLVAQKAKLGQYIKLDIESANLKPIALRIGRVLPQEGCFYVYVKNFGQTSKALFSLTKDQKIFVTGPLGISLDLPQNQSCYVPSSTFPDDFFATLKEDLLNLNNAVSHDPQGAFQWAFDETGKIKSNETLHTTKSPFLCMMQGLCGRCLTHTTKDGVQILTFGCTQGICSAIQN
jgi:NADPH-dependent glutamate synthase beta subunit-like oxidoreductase